jgi:hypothetical protein
MNSPVVQTPVAPPRLKWFMALNRTSKQYGQYQDFVKVAIHSAQLQGDLEPYLLFDGTDDMFCGWLRERGVTVISIRSSFYRQLAFWAKLYQRPEILSIGAGAFLRVEVPQVAQQLGITDRYLLYTDCDVMVRRSVSGLPTVVQPKLFAVAPEFQPDNYLHMNSGVMLMNLASLARIDWRFRRFIALGMFRFARLSWDQSAYRNFFSNRLRRTYRWDRLPLGYNWKPYWPANPDASIIHFHGPKPWQRAIMDTPSYPAGLRRLARDEFWPLCAEWDAHLAEAG